MSRRKRGADRSAATHTASPTMAVGAPRPSTSGDSVAAEVTPPAHSGRSIFPRLWLPILTVVAWLIALLALATFTANPITLNREQILRANFVVTGSFDAAQPNTVIVDKEWVTQANLQKLTVENLSETGGRPGRKYIFPLSKDANGGYFVTLTKDERPLIYPAEDEAVRQLETILVDHR